MSRYRLDAVDFSAPDPPIPLPSPPRRSLATPGERSPQSDGTRSPVQPPASSSPPRSTRELRRAERTPKRPETTTFVLETRHRDLIRTQAFEAGLYQWAWLSQVIVDGCAHIHAPLTKPRSLGPAYRPTLIHYTVNLSADARTVLNETAQRVANGDRSFLLRVLLDGVVAT